MSSTINQRQACLYAAPCVALVRCFSKPLTDFCLTISCYSQATWLVLLHRFNFRGDYLLLSHAIAFAALSCALSSSMPSDMALRISAEMGMVYTLSLFVITLGHRLSPWHPLASYPGPFMAKTTSLWLTYATYTGKRYLILDSLHARYGPFLRIGTHDTLYRVQASLILTMCRAKCSVHQLSRRGLSLPHSRKK